eukprot:ANDGO_06153.mRNA.1 putative serine/threonine-protein kinase nek3
MSESNYRRIKLVGKGTFGQAFLVQRVDNGKQFIMKKINISNMNSQERADAMNEVRLLSSLKHPNIVEYIESFTDTTGNLCIVMEYAERGDLYDAIKRQAALNKPFAEEQIVDWLLQVCLAIKHCHDKKILHRDIKSQNIFLTAQNKVKIGDFGIARVLKNTLDYAKTMVGTPYYMSPEICQEKPYNNKSDVWSIGCVLYELLTMRHAFDAQNMRGLVVKILRGVYPPVPTSYSEDLRLLVGQMFERDPRKRLSVNGILRTPLMRSRISKFLSESMIRKEGLVVAPAAPAVPVPRGMSPAFQFPPSQQQPIPVARAVPANGVIRSGLQPTPAGQNAAAPSNLSPPVPAPAPRNPPTEPDRRSQQIAQTPAPLPQQQNVEKQSALDAERRKQFFDAQEAARQNRLRALGDLDGPSPERRESPHNLQQQQQPAVELEGRKASKLDEQAKREADFANLQREYYVEMRAQAARNKARLNEDLGIQRGISPVLAAPANPSPRGQVGGPSSAAAVAPNYSSPALEMEKRKAEERRVAEEALLAQQRKVFFENRAQREENKRRLYEDLGRAPAVAALEKPVQQQPQLSAAQMARQREDEAARQRAEAVRASEQDAASKRKLEEDRMRREAAARYESKLREKETREEEKRRKEEADRQKREEWERQRAQKKAEEARMEAERKERLKKMMGNVKNAEPRAKIRPSSPPSVVSSGNRASGDFSRNPRLSAAEDARSSADIMDEMMAKEEARKAREAAREEERKKFREQRAKLVAQKNADPSSDIVIVEAPNRRRALSEPPAPAPAPAAAAAALTPVPPPVPVPAAAAAVSAASSSVVAGPSPSRSDPKDADHLATNTSQEGARLSDMDSLEDEIDHQHKLEDFGDLPNDFEPDADDLGSTLGTQDLDLSSTASSSDFEDEEDDNIADALAQKLQFDRPEADKFRLDGNTLRLPNLSERDSLAARIENLRMYIEKSVGVDAFLESYMTLQNIREGDFDDDEKDDGNRLQQELERILGADNVKVASLINQLIFCEDMMNEHN